jgi:polyisoprenoid-binding protein YceI
MTWWKLVLAAAVVSGSWLSATLVKAADSYQADTTHSSVVFRVKHMNTGYAWGRFNDITGSFVLDDQDPTQSQFEFQVEAASIDTGQAKRDQHLKSPDFFNAVQFPMIAFKSKAVASAGPSTFEVTGDLTLHGVTRPLTLKVVRTGAGKGPTGKPIAGIETNFAIRRSGFQMTKMVGPVGDDVWINVSVEGVKQ